MLAFGAVVRVRATPETKRAGIAGRTGMVTGFTTPSVTRVEVIGSVKDDHAIAVYFGDDADVRWFSSDLLEFVSHGAGQEVTVDGVNKKMIRNADGTWREEYFDNPRKGAKPWWRFW